MTIFSRSQRRLDTVDAIVERILATWPAEDLKFVKDHPADMVGLVGRAIRNEFNLWDPTHPLTSHWHLHPEARNIVDGVDFSEDHPDAVSEAILTLLRRKL